MIKSVLPSPPILGKPPRNVGLDVLRGIAILMVVVVHAPWPKSIRSGIFGPLLGLGTHGVDLFFVLSGFLISGLVFAEFDQSGRLNVRRFWIRRWFKIYPAYYVAYLVPFGYSIFARNLSFPDVIDHWPNLVLLQNYVHTETRWFASWSLAVEEHFYLVLPIALLLLGRRAVCWLCFGTVLICPILRGLESDITAVYLQTHTRADALAVGVALGYFWRYQRAAFEWIVFRLWPLLAIMPLAGMGVAYAFPVLDPGCPAAGRAIAYSALALGFAGWVAIVAVNPQWSSRGARLLALIGTYSYTIYLAQYGARTGTPRVSSLLACHPVASFLLLSIVIGILLAHLVERPALWLRERLTRSSRSKDAVQPAVSAAQ